MKRRAHNAIHWTPEMLDFLNQNFHKLTNKQLAERLGLKLTSVRTKCYSLGLKRMEMEYWTQAQIAFLKANYKDFGDTELAEIFEVKWHKNKGWTKKHIEKKRRYLKLKRTSSEMRKIKKRNTAMGRFSECAAKMWAVRGVAEIGERRVWFTADHLPFVVIKQKNGFVHYNRWLWKKKRGLIPKGMNIVNIGKDRINYTIDDLTLMTNAELAVHNSKNRTPEELRITQKLINKLQQKIQNYEQHS